MPVNRTPIQFVLYVGEIRTLILQVVKDTDGTPIADITGATCTVPIKKADGSNLFTADTASVSDGPTAKVAYTFPGAVAADDVGLSRGQVKLVIGAETILSEPFDIDVRADI